MPQRPKQRCPQCKRRHEGQGRCMECYTPEDRRRRGSGYAQGWTAEWARFRLQYLAAKPWCEWCGPPTLAKHLDHIDGGGRKGLNAYTLSNLRGLCVPCHSRRTAADQPGGWNEWI